jgi:hypothetical protein
MGGMARMTGLEPATSGVTGRHSNQLSYIPACGRKNSDWGDGVQPFAKLLTVPW